MRHKDSTKYQKLRTYYIYYLLKFKESPPEEVLIIYITGYKYYHKKTFKSYPIMYETHQTSVELLIKNLFPPVIGASYKQAS